VNSASAMSSPASIPPSGPRRLHPLSPLVRGWKALVAVAAVVAQQTGAQAGRQPPDVSGAPLPAGWAVLLSVAAVVLVALAVGWASWRFTTFVVLPDVVRVDSGVLVRRSRQVRLDRVQSIEVVRPGAARVLGLAELRLETAGGEQTVGSLAYLGEQEALALRAELLALAAGLTATTPAAPERVLYTVPTGDLVLSRLLQLPTLAWIVGGIGLLVTFAASGQWSLVGVLVPAWLALAATETSTVLTSYGFALAESPDGLRLRHGLIETRAETVPPGRVQAVALVEPLLWRRWRGWCRVEVNVAGRVGAEQTSVLLPVADRAVAEAVLLRVLPGFNLGRIPLAPAPARARWVDPLAAPVLGLGADERHIVSRTGRLSRTTVVVPHERIQSVRVRSGPLARRLGLATLAFDSTPGPVRPVAPHRDAAEARAVWESEVEAARRSRRQARPARWMTVPPH